MVEQEVRDSVNFKKTQKQMKMFWMVHTNVLWTLTTVSDCMYSEKFNIRKSV